MDTPPEAAPAPEPALRPVRLGFALFGAAVVLCTLGYLALAVPGPWFPPAQPITWGPAEFKIARGAGAIDGGALLITGVDERQTALVTISTDLKAGDYRAIAWDVANVPPDADVQVLWRSDHAPTKLHSIPVSVVQGRLLPVPVFDHPNWRGRIGGLALAIHAPLDSPWAVRRATAKVMGAPELLRDQVREWLAFERWTGTSINGVAGGAGIQDRPLPPFLAAAAALAILAALLLLRRPARIPGFPLTVAVIFATAWLASDALWQWNLARQVVASRDRYAGKDWHDKHLAAEDGALFSFIEHARAKLPAPPARVFMVAEAHYFRDRGAYHLYPHNVFFDPYRDVLPPASALRSGDYLVVYLRRGVQYAASQQRLRFPDGTTAPAELMLVERGGALFRIL